MGSVGGNEEVNEYFVDKDIEDEAEVAEDVGDTDDGFGDDFDDFEEGGGDGDDDFGDFGEAADVPATHAEYQTSPPLPTDPLAHLVSRFECNNAPDQHRVDAMSCSTDIERSQTSISKAWTHYTIYKHRSRRICENYFPKRKSPHCRRLSHRPPLTLCSATVVRRFGHN